MLVQSYAQKYAKDPRDTNLRNDATPYFHTGKHNKMLYDITTNRIDLTKYEGKVVINIGIRDPAFSSEWDKMPHHGKEGVWKTDQKSGGKPSMEELKPLENKDDDGEEIEDEKIYELSITPSVKENVLKNHSWLVYHWRHFGTGMESATISITERHAGPWSINIDDKILISGFFMDANVTSNVHNS